MNAIIKHENVYVFVSDKNKTLREDVNLEDSLILCKEKKVIRRFLYGGRVDLSFTVSNGVCIHDNLCTIAIDGITIKSFYVDSSNKVFSNNNLDISRAIAYLNQIENLGVDSFLENYKLQLQEIKKEFESMKDELQSELEVNYDENKASTLDSLNNLILSITIIIFYLLVNMNSRLNNQHYINAYNEIINMYF